MFVKKKTSDDPHVFGPSDRAARLGSLVAHRLDQFPLRRYSNRTRALFSCGLIPTFLRRQFSDLQPDLIHLHWINSGHVSIREIGVLPKPVLWTLHDMWPFTGGCHYSEACEAFGKGCGDCPQLGSGDPGDLSCTIHRTKRRAWAGRSMTLVAPSRWLAGKARTSTLFGEARIEVIPNGIDTGLFSPGDKRIARQRLGLPQNASLVLFGAVGATANPWKGYQHLRAAIEHLAARRSAVEFVVFGDRRPQKESDSAFKVHYLGSFVDELALSVVYSACDVFLAPSTEDNLPNTVMEAMSCGVPVVAFDIGGISDMVSHGENGFLAPAFQTEQLAEGVCRIVGAAATQTRFAEAARSTVLERFSLPLIAQRYRTLYRDLIESAR